MGRTLIEIDSEIAHVIRQRQLLVLEVSKVKTEAEMNELPIDKKWWAVTHTKISKMNTLLAKLHVERAKVRQETQEAIAAQQEEARRRKAARIAESEARSALYERQFIKTARQLLPPETYHILIDETRKAMGEVPYTELKTLKDAA